MRKRPYKIRYKVEPWNKPEEESVRVQPGIRVAKEHGYTDRLFVASIVDDDAGEIESILLLSTDGGSQPTREILEAVRDQINHHLEHHTE